MNNERRIQPVSAANSDMDELRLELEEARMLLAEAEAALAREQAAVNAFRMHARLILDHLVDQYLELSSKKESLIIELEFLRQGIAAANYADEDDPLDSGFWEAETAEGVEPLLPTPTPADKNAEKRLYRELARRFHPDLATSAMEQAYRTTMMAAINGAYADGDIAALYDLAGRASPEEAQPLAGQVGEAQKMVEVINKMRRLRRKAQHQLAALRDENTARLWRRAAALDQNDEDGWTVIRRELQEAIRRKEAVVTALNQEIAKIAPQEEPNGEQ